MKTNRLFTLLLPVLLLATFATTACPLIPTEPIEPHYIKAERLTFNAIEPAARTYLLEDGDLAPETRQGRLDHLNLWQANIIDGEVMIDSVLKIPHLTAERKSFGQITPWYLDYVNDDPNLSDDQKESRTDTVLSWDFALTRAERAAGLAPEPE